MIRALIAASIALVTIAAHAADGDSAFVLTPRIAQYDYDAVPKDPLASMFFSATFPGTGQIYNKEYLRGIITATAYYSGLYVFYTMLDTWDRMNTDTFWIAEVNPETGTNKYIYHQVTALKPDEELEPLPTREKIILGSAIVVTGVSYIWGIYDSYKGAKRYNQKLATAQARRKFDMRLAYSPRQQNFGVTAGYRF